VERLNQSYKCLLENHQALKAQNDELVVRIGLEQQFSLNPVIKGKQIEEDKRRAGLGRGLSGDDGIKEEVGLVGSRRR
jgi:hypothetical protein